MSALNAEGRQLAARRAELIAQGVNPFELEVPTAADMQTATDIALIDLAVLAEEIPRIVRRWSDPRILNDHQAVAIDHQLDRTRNEIVRLSRMIGEHDGHHADCRCIDCWTRP